MIRYRHTTTAAAAVLAAWFLLGAATPAWADGQGGANKGMELWRFIQPAGGVTLALLFCTVALAALRRLRPRLLLKLHKIFGILTLLAAICHALLVFLSD